jgi:hypothetical protein
LPGGHVDRRLKLIPNGGRKLPPARVRRDRQPAKEAAAAQTGHRVTPEPDLLLQQAIGVQQQRNQLVNICRAHLQLVELRSSLTMAAHMVVSLGHFSMRSIMMSRNDDIQPRPDVAVSLPPGVNGAPDLSRRRWLTGMLAGPAVVSLPSSASAAAFGSISTCVENGLSAQSILLHVPIDQPDGYAREECSGCVVYKGGGNGYREECLVEYGSGKLMDCFWNEWWWKGTNQVTNSAGDTMKFDGTMVKRLRLVFAQVDDVGEFLTANPDSTYWGATPVTGSCYVSIAGLI